MRVLLPIAFALSLVATPAFAGDVFDKAAALVAEHDDRASDPNLIQLSKTLPATDAQTIDAAFTAEFGEPISRRRNLKIWEVPNPKAEIGRASVVTIMCGREDDGFAISIDARAPKADAPRRQSNLKRVKATPRASASRVTPQPSLQNPRIKPGVGDYD